MTDPTPEYATRSQPPASCSEALIPHGQARLYQLVMQNCQQAVVFTDRNNVIREVNDAYCAMTGFSRAEAIGQTPSIGKSGRHDDAFYRQMWEALEKTNYWSGEIWDRRSNGEAYPKHLSITRLVDEQGQVVNYVAMFEDLTWRKELESKLEHHTHYDSLTGLANKVLFRNRLEHEFRISERRNCNVGLLLLNLDRFRQVNESLGYVIGDRLLQAVAIRLADNIRKTDLIARENNLLERSADTISRYDGDEFTFILADLAEPENAAIATRRLISSFEAPFVIDEQEIFLSASIGIAIYPQNADTLEGLMCRVENALDEARQAGGNCFRFYSEAMNQTSSNRFRIESDMRRAIGSNGFALAYQPKIKLASGELLGVEALVRWKRGDGQGLVPPADFIPLAEETGLILPLGAWILETACREIHAINQAHGLELSVAVNLSARQFQYGRIPELIDKVLAASGLPPHRLELEITESMVMQDVETAIKTMQDIRRRGVTLAIDDFGTGYSSLAYLKMFPLNTLKIDRSFVENIEIDANNATICDVTVLLAHKMGLEVVAEGVETAEQLNYLLSIGCDNVQGYLICKPLPAPDIEQFIANHRPSTLLGTVDLWEKLP